MTMVEVESRLTALEAEVASLREQLARTQTSVAMRRSIKQIELGQGIPAVEAVKALGRKYGVSKS